MKKGIKDFIKMKQKNEPTSWVTAYDYPFAYCAEQAGIDMILVGDSGGMVQLGYESTNPVTMDEMITMAKAVRKGAPDTFIIGDMPQGAYEISTTIAVENALRFVKEAGCDAIKCEGGIRVADKVKAIVDAGILVCGHLGLTPQSTSSFGGYKVQGKSLYSFENIVKDALSLQDAGIYALLLEAIPTESARQISKHLTVPVYGIGAGPYVDGQLLIMHDILGFYQPFRPKFAECFIPEIIYEYCTYLDSIKAIKDIHEMGVETRRDGLLVLVQLTLEIYIRKVKNKTFPREEHFYQLSEKALSELRTSEYWIV